jgi:hypothetical protein
MMRRRGTALAVPAAHMDSNTRVLMPAHLRMVLCILAGHDRPSPVELHNACTWRVSAVSIWHAAAAVGVVSNPVWWLGGALHGWWCQHMTAHSMTERIICWVALDSMILH